MGRMGLPFGASLSFWTVRMLNLVAMKPKEKLRQIYSKIPTFECKPGCTDLKRIL
jgi:hypothetical protein